jgi:hypothetical protein
MRQGPFLELSIRRGRENRKIGYAVFYEDLVHQVPFLAIVRGSIGKLRLHPLPADDSVEH